MESNELINNAYNAIDILLKELISGKAHGITDLKLPPYSQQSSIALEIMEKYSLIKLRAPNSPMSLADITTRGIEVENMGGIRIFLDSLQEQNNSSSQVQKLTKQVLEMQIASKEKEDALKDIQTRLTSLHLEDYPETRKLAKDADVIGKKSLSVAKWSMVIAVLSLVTIVAIELLKHYKIWPFEEL